MIVAADGSGDWKTIQEAVDAVPEDNKQWVTIQIKNGVYREKLHIEKPYIRLSGEETENTVIEYGDYAKKRFPNGELYHTFHSYTIFIGADNFTSERITFANTAGRGEEVGQALAAYVDGDRVSFRDCRFIGHQDTLFTGPLPAAPMKRSSFGGPRDGAPVRNVRQYYEDCYIEGDVDFIFGSATAVFRRCEIFSKNRLTFENEPGFAPPEASSGWITAASTPEDVPFGYVFIGCRLTGDAPPHSVYLGRPWRNHAKVAFLSCWMGEHIRPEGWHNWNKPESESTAAYAEYRNIGPGSDPIRRASWTHQLSEAEAEAYTVASIMSGEDGWRPHAED
ncbi:pectinesterase family protein [Paenibacillus tarimensis]